MHTAVRLILAAAASAAVSPGAAFSEPGRQPPPAASTGDGQSGQAVAGPPAGSFGGTSSGPARVPVLVPSDPAALSSVPERSSPWRLGLERSELERQQALLRAQTEQLNLEVNQVRRRIREQGRAYVRMTRVGLLPISGGIEALLEHARRTERLRAALARELARSHELQVRSRAVAASLKDIETRLAALELKEQAVAEAQTALLEAQDRELAFQRAFMPSGPGPYTAVYGAAAGPTDPTELASGFASMKGRLPLPVVGRAELRTVHRPDAQGPGLELVVPAGTPVRAVYPGRVAFADRYLGFGNTVLLDHGNGYYTLSGELATVSVVTGQQIDIHSRIGTVGQSARGPMLYFEIRHGAESLDPAEWFGL